MIRLSILNKALHTVAIRLPILKKWPDWVRSTALMACAKPAPKNKTPSNRRACNDSPLHPRRKRHGQQRQNRNPDQRRNQQAAGNPEIAPRPTPPARLACTRKRISPGTHVICESRMASTDDLAQHILGPEKRTAEIQRQRAVGEIGRNQSRPGKGGQKKRKCALHGHEIEKELVVDGKHALGTPTCSERSRCAPGKSRAGIPAARRSTPHTSPSQTWSETGSAGNSGIAQDTATTRESDAPEYGL